MDRDYPPLPSSGLGASIRNLSLHDATAIYPYSSEPEETPAAANGKLEVLDQSEKPQPAAKVILSTGDVIVEYVCPDRFSEAVSHRWQVSSKDLTQNSPYFRALLDPNKFSEGRSFMEQKTIRAQQAAAQKADGTETSSVTYDGHTNDLPIVRLPGDHFLSRPGVDAVELFLKILSFNSFGEEEKGIFDSEMRYQNTSLTARLVELADAFNSPHVVRNTLKRTGFAFGRKAIFPKFDSSMLKLSEDRIRQTIFIARFMDHHPAFQIFTHTLIILGSKHWVNGVEMPTSVTFRWRYFSDGLEEELYHRRQCILNTITDLQAYFLRAYGALEGAEDPKPVTTYTSMAATTVQPRQYQCRFGFGNSSACDAFHLGQMTRFFALRTKTIFLGSSLIDPDFGLDSDSDDAADRPQQSAPPTDITAIIASLKQCPDYQIDSSHSGCGVRRRILPPLDCIERFVGDGRGLVGIDLQHWDAKTGPLATGSWANRSLRRALAIDIHFSKIGGIPRMSPGKLLTDCQEENARLLFTAKKRNWEA